MAGAPIRVDVRILDERIRAALPAYATEGAAGMDLRACIDAPITLAPGDTALVPTGIAIHIGDPGYALMLTLKPTVDILAEVAARSDTPFCVGFAAESHDVVRHGE